MKTIMKHDPEFEAEVDVVLTHIMGGVTNALTEKVNEISRIAGMNLAVARASGMDEQVDAWSVRQRAIQVAAQRLAVFFPALIQQVADSGRGASVTHLVAVSAAALNTEN